MARCRKWTEICLWILGILIVLTAGTVLWGWYLYGTADLGEPAYTAAAGDAVQENDSLRRWKTDALRLNSDGLYEMRVSGSAFERGESMGKLGKELLYSQEKAFTDKIFELVPDRRYVRFLHGFITVFNRRLGASVPLEYRQELKAMSESCTHEFDEFGSPYERQMQYHAAHDIGHVMQDYMLVACTSFAAWGKESADSALILARNFDFYMGDEFSRNKLVLFEKPDSGYAYVSVTWPGMTGVLSGMNTKGLTVTINAAKFETPRMSATPISMLAKRILQYASNLEEAWKIAGEYRTFVSESIMVGSAEDGRAAIIEKTPSDMALFDPGKSGSAVSHIICTNHYQSDKFRDVPVNVENVRESDSGYRFRRVEECLDSAGPLDPCGAAAILRDMRGVGGEDVGYCNELSINQMIAMHSVIFRPSERKIWVSTSPWQLGRFVCYSLDDVLDSDFSGRVDSENEAVPEDACLHDESFVNVLGFRKMLAEIRKAARTGRPVPQDSLDMFISCNPSFYGTYEAVSDYLESAGRTSEVDAYRKKALSCAMKLSERKRLEHLANH